MLKVTAISATLAAALIGCAGGQTPTNQPVPAGDAPAAAPAAPEAPANPVEAKEADAGAAKKEGKAGGCGAGGCGGDHKKAEGKAVSRIHMIHVWPFPYGLDAIFGRFKAVLIPEMNMGQMARLMRSEYPQHNFISYPKVTGQPFLQTEILAKIDSILNQ